MELQQALGISAAGMEVQTARLRVIAENLANQSTTGSTPGAEAYRRKTVMFDQRTDKVTGVETVQVKQFGHDMSNLPLRFDPANPAANVDGYVKIPNVNTFIEVTDMHEAEHSYAANLAVMQATRDMLIRTIELLK